MIMADDLRPALSTEGHKDVDRIFSVVFVFLTSLVDLTLCSILTGTSTKQRLLQHISKR